MKYMIAAAALALPLLVSAETQAERGTRVVKESLAVLGGAKFQSVRDRVETGRAYSFYREQLRGLAVAKVSTRYTDPVAGHTEPAQLERQAYGKDEDQVIVFPGRARGYILTYRGAKPLPDDRLFRYRESTLRNLLYLMRVRLNDPGMSFLSKGTDVIDNIPVELVEIVDPEGRSTIAAFHRTTKLPVRQSYEYRDEKTKERTDEIVYYSKWRDVGGGVMWPFHMERLRNGEKVFEIFSEHVVVNQNVPDTAFMIPNGMKTLAAEKQ